MKTNQLSSNAEQPSAYEVAASFILKDETGKLSLEDQEALSLWLEDSPSHRQAYEDAYRACAIVTNNAADPEMMALRGAALSLRGERTTSLKWYAAAGALLVVSVLIAIGVPQGPQIPSKPVNAIIPAQTSAPDPNSATYTTAIGERLTIALPDGSAATLDTNSAIRIAYTGQERGVQLLKGQALFEVAKHKPIPFQVYAGNRRITAVGTKFDVRLDRGKVRVALLEGVVKVTTEAPPGASADAASQTITLAAGEVAEAAAAAPIRVATADTDKIASWRSGVLEFSDVSLDQAVAEMNRYTPRAIVIADASLSKYRVSGVFKTGDPEHFADTMAEVFPLKVTRNSEGAPVLDRQN